MKKNKVPQKQRFQLLRTKTNGRDNLGSQITGRTTSHLTPFTPYLARSLPPYVPYNMSP